VLVATACTLFNTPSVTERFRGKAYSMLRQAFFPGVSAHMIDVLKIWIR